MGSVVHAAGARRQRPEGRRRAFAGHGHRNGFVVVPRIPGGRRVGPVRLSEPCGVRTTGQGGRLPEERRNDLENRENVGRVSLE